MSNEWISILTEPDLWFGAVSLYMGAKLNSNMGTIKRLEEEGRIDSHLAKILERSTLALFLLGVALLWHGAVVLNKRC